MDNILHISFATPNYSQSASVLRRSAVRFGIENIDIYSSDSPAVKRVFKENPEITPEMRGAGYWLWKPYIILDAFDRVPDGTLVLYTDVGVEYIADPKPLFELAEHHDVVLFENKRAELTQGMFTKRDCFILLDADNRANWNRRQLDAAVQLYRAGPLARRFVTELKNCMGDPRVLTDMPNLCGAPNRTEFIDHRHDQSVLTILSARHKIATFRNPSVLFQPNDSRSRYPKIFHHHRKRNVSGADSTNVGHNLLP